MKSCGAQVDISYPPAQEKAAPAPLTPHEFCYCVLPIERVLDTCHHRSTANETTVHSRSVLNIWAHRKTCFHLGRMKTGLSSKGSPLDSPPMDDRTAWTAEHQPGYRGRSSRRARGRRRWRGRPRAAWEAVRLWLYTAKDPFFLWAALSACACGRVPRSDVCGLCLAPTRALGPFLALAEGTWWCRCSPCAPI